MVVQGLAENRSEKSMAVCCKLAGIVATISNEVCTLPYISQSKVRGLLRLCPRKILAHGQMQQSDVLGRGGVAIPRQRFRGKASSAWAQQPALPNPNDKPLSAVRTWKTQLLPGFVKHDGHRIGKIQTAAFLTHRQINF